MTNTPLETNLRTSKSLPAILARLHRLDENSSTLIFDRMHAIQQERHEKEMNVTDAKMKRSRSPFRKEFWRSVAKGLGTFTIFPSRENYGTAANEYADAAGASLPHYFKRVEDDLAQAIREYIADNQVSLDILTDDMIKDLYPHGAPGQDASAAPAPGQ